MFQPSTQRFRGGNGVSAWGEDKCKATSDIQDQLLNIQQIQSTCDSFSAICGENADVVTWGDPDIVASWLKVKEHLTSVQDIQATQ